MFLDGFESGGIGRQEAEFVPASLDEFPSFPGFVEGGVVHDDQGAGLEFPQELFLEVLVKDGGVQAPLKKERGEEPCPLGGGRDEVGPRPASPAALPKDLAAPGGPCVRAVGGPLEPGLIKVDRAAGTLLQALSQVREVLDPACGFPFAVAGLFFFRVAPIRPRACRMEPTLTLKWAARSRWRASGCSETCRPNAWRSSLRRRGPPWLGERSGRPSHECRVERLMPNRRHAALLLSPERTRAITRRRKSVL